MPAGSWLLLDQHCPTTACTIRCRTNYRVLTTPTIASPTDSCAATHCMYSSMSWLGDAQQCTSHQSCLAVWLERHSVPCSAALTHSSLSSQQHHHRRYQMSQLDSGYDPCSGSMAAASQTPATYSQAPIIHPGAPISCCSLEAAVPRSPLDAAAGSAACCGSRPCSAHSRQQQQSRKLHTPAPTAPTARAPLSPSYAACCPP